VLTKLALGFSPLFPLDHPFSRRSHSLSRTRGEVNKQSRSRDAPWHPSFAARFKKALPIREAERRQAQLSYKPHRRMRLRAQRGARAFRRSTADSLWRINAAAQLQPRFLGSASSGVTRIFPYPSPASSSQAGRYYRPGGVRSRPGAGVWPARGHRTRSASESTLAKASLMSELAGYVTVMETVVKG
jgi:hypothetical protein